MTSLSFSLALASWAMVLIMALLAYVGYVELDGRRLGLFIFTVIVALLSSVAYGAKDG